jgi:hypothetical protein
MLKVITLAFGCSKFLLFILDVQSFLSYTWILKVLIFVLFYVIRPNFHYVSIHQHQNYVYKVRFFQKYLKLYFNLLDCKHSI